MSEPAGYTTWAVLQRAAKTGKGRIIIGAVLVLGLALSLLGCEGRTGSSDITPADTTSTTQTTEVQQLTFESMIHPTLTAEDVKNMPPAKVGKANWDYSNIPNSIQKEFEAIYGDNIKYFGENNVGDLITIDNTDMKDIFVRGADLNLGDKADFGTGGFTVFGGNWGLVDKEGNITTGGLVGVTTKTPIIPIPDEQGKFVPGRDAFYLELENPRTKDLIYIRIKMSNSKYGKPTLAYCKRISERETGSYFYLDLAAGPKDTIDGSSSWLYQNSDTFNMGNLTPDEIAQFFAPHTTVYAYAAGDTSNFNPKRWINDGNILVARGVITLGNATRAAQQNAMFTN